jgi:hypothetical protein
MSERLVVDRFEGAMAICERPDRSTFAIPRERLPEETKEGDVLIEDSGRIDLDLEATRERRAEIERKTKGLWKE